MLAYVVAAILAAVPIDRQTLVTRHNPTLHQVDPAAPLTVGNGGFAFTVDATGLQTFADAYYRQGVPLETLSRWAWVSDDNPRGFTLADAAAPYALPEGRVQPFPTRTDFPARTGCGRTRTIIRSARARSNGSKTTAVRSCPRTCAR